MSFVSRLARRLSNLVRRDRVEREMAAEISHHLELEIEERIRLGQSPEEARRQALIDFGGVERFKEESRDARGLRVFHDAAQDLKYTVRVLRANLGFTVGAIVILGLGIASTTVVVSAARDALAPDMGVRHPGELYVLTETRSNGMSATHLMGPVYPYEHYERLAEATGDVFQGVLGMRHDLVSLRVGQEARVIGATLVSPNYFDVFGLRPALGRFFTVLEDGAGAPESEAVIGHDFWMREFSGDSSVVGRTVFIDSRPLVVVGVAPAEFKGTIAALAPDVWIPVPVYRHAPIAADGSPGETRAAPWVTMVGRLAPGRSPGQATAALNTIGPTIETTDADAHVVAIRLDPLRGVPPHVIGTTLGFIGMITITAAMVLLVAATNVAGMLLARSVHRRREIAVRLALGASRSRVVRQLITETATLGLLGAGTGILLAIWLMSLIPAVQVPVAGRVVMDFGIDPLVLGTSIAVALGTGLLTGLAPALRSTRVGLGSGLRTADAGMPRTQSRLRTAFVVGQLTVSLVLLITAGLFARGVQRGLQLDPGFATDGVGTSRIDLARHGYGATQTRAFLDELIETLEATPGIEAAGLGQWTPFSGSYNGSGGIVPEGAPADATPLTLMWGVADPGYFNVLGTPLVAGRTFTDRDSEGATPVIVINETLATRAWPGESPLGKRLSFAGTLREVVGVVADSRVRSFAEAPRAYAYLSLQQRPTTDLVVYARARGDAGDALRAIRTAIVDLDPNIAVESPLSLADQVALPLLPQRIVGWLVAGFGVLGLLLAAFGVYGIISYHVATRTREFGIRLALGAPRRGLIGNVLKHAVLIMGVATLIGMAVSLGTARVIMGFFFGVGAIDPLSVVLVPIVLGAVALCAGYIPARRVSRVDPVASLRAE